MMAVVESVLKNAGCPKINVQVRGTNASAIRFYQHIGYKVDDVVGLGKRIEHDTPE